jgi:hypothetical protein|tara:strand:- start:110 stop:283 length:174 start_codon:yes stop_codon:yes gene_type:complete
MTVIKTTTGEASFIIEEKFDDEVKAEEGKEPTSSEVKDLEIKINNTKWRKIDEQSTS